MVSREVTKTQAKVGRQSVVSGGSRSHGRGRGRRPDGNFRSGIRHASQPPHRSYCFVLARIWRGSLVPLRSQFNTWYHYFRASQQTFLTFHELSFLSIRSKHSRVATSFTGSFCQRRLNKSKIHSKKNQ